MQDSDATRAHLRCFDVVKRDGDDRNHHCYQCNYKTGNIHHRNDGPVSDLGHTFLSDKVNCGIGEEHRHTQPHSLPRVRVHKKCQESRKRDEDEREDDRSGVRQRFTLQVKLDEKLETLRRNAKMRH